MDVVDLANLAVFGHTSFRPQQRASIDDALAGRDVFVIMPTGAGKSLTYQLPAAIGRGVTVVVEPLTSLILDQVNALVVRCADAAAVRGLRARATAWCATHLFPALLFSRG